MHCIYDRATSTIHIYDKEGKRDRDFEKLLSGRLPMLCTESTRHGTIKLIRGTFEVERPKKNNNIQKSEHGRLIRI